MTGNADRSDAIRRMNREAYARWEALGRPASVRDILARLTAARAAYQAAFAVWRPMSTLDAGWREAKDRADETSREVSALMHIADALGATVKEVDAALAAAS